MREIPYEMQTVDNPNPLARFAHRARMRRSMQLVKPFLTGSATLMDYGCGQGRFLGELATEMNGQAVTLLGYDPYQSAQFEGYRIVSDPDEIAAGSVDVVTSLEVCEHLTDPEMEEFVDFTVKVMSPGARLLVTVPIMLGPTLLVKELSRSILFRRGTDYSTADLLKGTFLGKPAKRAEDIKISHRGFDWRVTLDRLRQTFSLEHTEFSPLPFNHWYGQSQVMTVFRKA
jgi:2-polyprenyl-3-methyl-5-hydroxy-6-metoxy-1,4-benzoquinol methylase